MNAYQTNHDGVFVGEIVCDESPLEAGVYLIPAGAVTLSPPEIPDGMEAVWDGSSWNLRAVIPEPDPDVASVIVYDTWDKIRSRRDGLLDNCDWTQVADAPVDSAAWAVYRQALRDIPQDFATPDAVVWPEQP